MAKKGSKTLKASGDYIILHEVVNEDGDKTGETRMTLETYKGRRFLDIRKWFLNDKDEWQSTQKGIAISSVGVFTALKNALKENEGAIVAFLDKKK